MPNGNNKTDKERFIEFLDSVNIDYDEWNEFLIYIDSGTVEAHFDSKGNMTGLFGSGDGYG